MDANCTCGEAKNAALYRNCGLLKLAVYGALCYYNSCDSWPSESNGGNKEEQQDLYKGTSKCQVFANSASMQLSGVLDDWKK